MVTGWRTIFLSLLIWGLWTDIAAAVRIQAIVGHDQIVVGDSLELQLRIDGIPDAEPDFTALQKNWEILSRSQSTQRQLIDSSFKRSTVYSLTLMPRGLGSLMIPAVCFDQDCSLPLPIEVLPRSSQGTPANEQILLETEISTPKIVTQGQLLLKVRLSFRVDVAEGQLSEPQPVGVEVLVKRLNTDVRKYKKREDGLVYQVIERDYAIFPQGSGQMQIPPLQFDGAVAAGSSRLNPFGRRQLMKRVRRISQPLQVEVTPLPGDLGRRPWIPANSIGIQDDWQQQLPKLVVGEPAIRTLRLSADGVLSAQLPELKPAVPDGFKVYPDQPSRKDQGGRDGIKGVMVQKIALVPTRPGRFQLPAVDLDWWDMKSGRWRRAHLAALDIDVAPAPVPAPAAPVPETGEQQPTLMPVPALKSVAGGPAAAGAQASDPVFVAGPEAPEGTSKPLVWLWVSLGFVLGCLLTLTLLFFRRRYAPTATEYAATDAQSNEKSARRIVAQAARSHNPQATRQALLVWSRALWPTVQYGAYEQLCRAADPVMLKELENLDLCLYGRSELVWDGRGMIEILAVWRPSPPVSATSDLPVLYPVRSDDN